jgi:hypothetical protein
LEAELRERVARHGLVIWLDADNHYSDFVDRLIELRAAGDLKYEVRAFRGSHLQLMLDLEGLAGGLDKSRLVIHLPGFNEEAVRKTPLFELYSAGVRYRKALDTLVTEAAAGDVHPEQIASFCQQEGLTLALADQWLNAHLTEGGEGLAGHLRNLTLTALIDDLLGDGHVANHLDAEADRHAVWERLGSLIGLTQRWREVWPTAGSTQAKEVAFTAASWALCVEYIHDLQHRQPVGERLRLIPELPAPVVDACSQLATHLRDRHADFYAYTAAETEAALVDEVEAAQAADLGQIDTFLFEEELVLKAALTAIADHQWDVAAKWVELRQGDRSFWLRQEPARRSEWQLIDDAARLGQSIDAAGTRLDVTENLEAAVDRYVQRGAAVDQAHRHLEQRRLALLYPHLPKFETLRTCLDGMRRHWRSWADAWARDFNAVCTQRGFLPPAALQQRTLFDEVVRPLVQEPGTTALFLIDAFRFEMGEELYAAISDSQATTAHLRGRLAELPTVTEVGMNVLPPVSDAGRLRPKVSGGKILGFSTGQFRVSNEDTRKRAMYDRIGGGTCPWLTLNDVMTRDAKSLKQAIARAQLVIVYCREIDDAGEKGVGLSVFDNVMQRLRAAWRMLRDAGVRQFVFTADHGFLLLDENAPQVQSHGRKIDPKRRHVFSEHAANHKDEVRVSLADLAYDGETGYFMFPESTAVFDTGDRSMSYVHGGNSLQERVIPVLTLSHRAAVGSSTLRYSVAAQPRSGVAGMHCVEARVDNVAQQSLDFGGSGTIELGLRVSDETSVQVELCEIRGGARLSSGAVIATIGEPFELFFRLSGSTETRVRIELFHTGAEADVSPCAVEGRFAVTAARTSNRPNSLQPVASKGREWSEELPDDGARQVFLHLAEHGVVTESEAATMLGSQRAARRFAMRFDELAAKVPFNAHIEVVAGVKRYVREGTST